MVNIEDAVKEEEIIGMDNHINNSNVCEWKKW